MRAMWRLRQRNASLDVFPWASLAGFNGLLSKAYTVVGSGASVVNLDPFVDARFAAEAHGANLTH